jgi:predicted MFS family arabinose efflux permease
VGIGVLAATMRFVPESRQENAVRHFDLAGAVTVTSGLMVMVYAIVKAQQWGWGSTTTLAWAAGAIALLVAFVAIERRSRSPLVRLSFFRMRWISTANATMFVVAGGMFGMFYFASLYVQEILGYGPLKAGAAFLPVSAGIMVGAGLSQQLIGRVGVKPVVMAGMTLAAGGLAALAATTKLDGTYLALLAGLLPMAVGMGLTFVPLTLIGTAGVAPADAGLASGTFNTSQQVGGALGLAVLATLASNKTGNVLGGLGHAPSVVNQHQALVDGFQVAFVAAAILMAAGLALVTVVLRRRDVENVQVGEAVAVAA